jgi:hypothetical protein
LWSVPFRYLFKTLHQNTRVLSSRQHWQPLNFFVPHLPHRANQTARFGEEVNRSQLRQPNIVGTTLDRGWRGQAPAHSNRQQLHSGFRFPESDPKYSLRQPNNWLALFHAPALHATPMHRAPASLRTMRRFPAMPRRCRWGATEASLCLSLGTAETLLGSVHLRSKWTPIASVHFVRMALIFSSMTMSGRSQPDAYEDTRQDGKAAITTLRTGTRARISSAEAWDSCM